MQLHLCKHTQNKMEISKWRTEEKKKQIKIIQKQRQHKQMFDLKDSAA